MEQHEADLRNRTKAFALQVIRLYGELPRRTEAQVLGNQVLRSGTSVGANSREADRARSKAEFIAKCGDSLKELEKTSNWLELLAEGRIVPVNKLAAPARECDKLAAIFVTIIQRTKEGEA